MAWSLVKHRDNFTFYLNLLTVNNSVLDDRPHIYKNRTSLRQAMSKLFLVLVAYKILKKL